MTQIAQNLEDIRKTIPKNTTLVAVSKTYPAEVVREAYDAGQRVFGENKAQELSRKQPLLPVDVEWHFIGHLQSNKIKYIAPFVKLIHSVDSFKLLQAIDKEAKKVGRTIDCLLQFHIAEEENKFGLDMKEAVELLHDSAYLALKNIRLTGVMGMATFTEDLAQVRKEFIRLRQIFERLKTDFFPNDGHFKEISMGMSDDYRVAIEEGSTIVRIGSAIFGRRNY